MIEAEKKGPLTDKPYLEAQEKRRKATLKIEEAFDEHQLDALIAPTEGIPWLIDLVHGDPSSAGTGTAGVAAVSGQPHITVPAGYIYGLPVGLSFIGRAFSEPTLFRLAYAFEQATKIRKPPMFLPTADLSDIG